MNRYVIGSVATGEILRSVICESDQVAAQVQAGEVLDLHDTAGNGTHHFVSGAVMAYTAPHAAEKAERRGDAVWSNVAFAWQDLRSLAEVKLAKNAEINESRMTANRETFTFAGKLIACDELSRSDIDAVNGMVSLTNVLPPGFPGGWKAVDNTYVAIPDLAAWISFYGAMVQQGTANFNYAQALKATLLAATTIADSEQISW